MAALWAVTSYIGSHSPVTALELDARQERLWEGMDSGLLYSRLLPSTDLHCAVRAHAGRIHCVHSFLRGVISVSDETARVHSMGGLLLASLGPPVAARQPDAPPVLLQCVRPAAGFESSQFLLGSSAPMMTLHDAAAAAPGEPLAAVLLSHDAMFMEAGRHLVVGGADGSLSLLDPLLRSLDVVRTLPSHTGGLRDMSAAGDLLVTIGNVRRGAVASYHGHAPVHADHAIKVFDLRMMRETASLGIVLPPGVVPVGVRFAPAAIGARLLVVDVRGACHVVDVRGAMSDAEYFAVDTSGAAPVACAFSSSGHVVAVSDGSGVHIVAAGGGVAAVNEMSEEAVVPAPHTPSERPVTPEGEAPAGLSYANTDTGYPLLSDFPAFMEDLPLRPRPALEVSDELMGDARRVEFLQYITNPGFAPNSMLFGLEAARAAYVDPDPRRVSSRAQRSRLRRAGSAGEVLAISRAYRVPRVKLGRLGMSDFDFSVHNSTPWVGLENAGPNSYCCAALLLLYFDPHTNALVRGHICAAVNCITCELRFVFDNLDGAREIEAPRRTMHAANFLRMLRLVPEASALGLLWPSHMDAVGRFARFVRFVLDKVQKELLPANPPGFGEACPDAVFGWSVRTHNVCLLGHQDTREHRALAVDLLYPESPAALAGVTFTGALQASLSQRRRTRAWCESCGNYVITTQASAPVSLPRVLIVNAAASDAARREIWTGTPIVDAAAPPAAAAAAAAAAGVAAAVAAVVDGVAADSAAAAAGHADGDDGDDGGAAPAPGKKYKPFAASRIVVRAAPENHTVSIAAEGADALAAPEAPGGPSRDITARYVLAGVFSHVLGEAGAAAAAAGAGAAGKALGREDDDSREHVVGCMCVDAAGRLSGDGQWLVFNDFRVSPTTAEEAADFSPSWKTPITLVYVAVAPSRVPHIPVAPLVCTVFSASTPMALIPSRGQLVAIDAEFVALSLEEAELLPDGERVVKKQARLSLGRVSCLTVSGSMLIDDRIAATEPIVDYLTRFSGLAPGDLDPSVSRYPLVPIKAAYLRLRFLRDQGCRFVGHGVEKDFRIINMHVPDAQVVDTVKLFRLPNQRNIGLRFLAAYLLKADIQSSVHDSLEDARTTLRLWNAYSELERTGRLDAFLNELYASGRASGWKSAGGINLG